jgi:hypothetical protein
MQSSVSAKLFDTHLESSWTQELRELHQVANRVPHRLHPANSFRHVASSRRTQSEDPNYWRSRVNLSMSRWLRCSLLHPGRSGLGSSLVRRSSVPSVRGLSKLDHIFTCLSNYTALLNSTTFILASVPTWRLNSSASAQFPSGQQ